VDEASAAVRARAGPRRDVATTLRIAQAVAQTGKVDPALNGAQLPRLDASTYGGFLGGLRFAADHTVMYDSNIALTVSGGGFEVADTLRSDAGG
jgi:hypothetical protein